MSDERVLQPLWGAKAISEVVGLTPAATFYALETGKIPGRKVGARWMSELGELKRWMTDLNTITVE